MRKIIARVGAVMCVAGLLLLIGTWLFTGGLSAFTGGPGETVEEQGPRGQSVTTRGAEWEWSFLFSGWRLKVILVGAGLLVVGGIMASAGNEDDS